MKLGKIISVYSRKDDKGSETFIPFYDVLLEGENVILERVPSVLLWSGERNFSVSILKEGTRVLIGFLDDSLTPIILGCVPENYLENVFSGTFAFPQRGEIYMKTRSSTLRIGEEDIQLESPSSRISLTRDEGMLFSVSGLNMTLTDKGLLISGNIYMFSKEKGEFVSLKEVRKVGNTKKNFGERLDEIGKEYVLKVGDLSQYKGRLKIEVGDNINIVSGKNIEMKSDAKDLKMEAKNNITGSAINIKFSSSANIELTANTLLKASGSIVEIKGTGSVKISSTGAVIIGAPSVSMTTGGSPPSEPVVKFTSLKNYLNQIINSLNSLISSFNTHVHVSSSPGNNTSAPVSPLTISFSPPPDTIASVMLTVE